MAVPKKRRLGYKICNRSATRLNWISKALNRALLKIMQTYLYNVTYPSLPYISNTKLRLTHRQDLISPYIIKKPLKTFRLTRLAPFRYIETPLDVVLQVDRVDAVLNNIWYNSNLRKKNIKKKLTKRARILLYWNWYLNTSLCSMVASSNYNLRILCAINHNKFLKQTIIKVYRQSHKWGGQRSFLLKAWELTPSYLRLVPSLGRLPWFKAIPLTVIFINPPQNLLWPKGPTLKQLWHYAKTNPNEGYWIYCMWLQVWKRWKRWFKFPFVYFIKRTPWKRQNLYGYFIESLTTHWNRYPVRLLKFLKLNYPMGFINDSKPPKNLKHSWFTSLGFNLVSIYQKLLFWSYKFK